jgi:hypothetical protein
MRILLSLGGLLLVLLLVSKLAGTPLQALAPAGGAQSALGTPTATPGAAASAVAAQVMQAMEQGVAQRAADAASR